MSVGIEQLAIDDLADCLELARDRDWRPELHKWTLLLQVGTVYGVRDATGALVGTTILTRFGGGLAAISMVLVAARCGGRGLGRALMTRALADAGDDIVCLNATGPGRPLYEKLGFVTVSATHSHSGPFTGPGSGVSRLAQAADLPAIEKLDADVIGADRARLVRHLPAFCEQLRVIECDGELLGYGGAWRNTDNVVIGPVVARSEEDATALVADLAAPVDGSVRLDVDARHPRLREWARARGLVPGFTSSVMVRGGAFPGDRSRWFVPLMQALG